MVIPRSRQLQLVNAIKRFHDRLIYSCHYEINSNYGFMTACIFLTRTDIRWMAIKLSNDAYQMYSQYQNIEYVPWNIHTVCSCSCFAVAWKQSVLPVCFTATLLAAGNHAVPEELREWAFVIPDSKIHGTNMGPIWGRQDNQVDRSGTHVVFVYATDFHSRDNNVYD